VAAFASLSGKEINEIGQTLKMLPGSLPKLFMWGSDQGSDFLTSPAPEDWDAMSSPKHSAILNDIGHWDYLPPGLSACESPRGPCGLTPQLAAELLMMFFGRYLVPEGAPDLQARIASSLLPPTQAAFQLPLSLDQQFYAGAFLGGFENLGPACQVTLAWDTGADSGTITTP
jgi:hypothetical protein